MADPPSWTSPVSLNTVRAAAAGPLPWFLATANLLLVGLLAWSPIGRPAATSYGAFMPWQAAVLIIVVVVAGITLWVAPLAPRVTWPQALLSGILWGAVGGFLAGLVLLPVLVWGAPVVGPAVMAWLFSLFLAMGAGSMAGAACGLLDKALAAAFRKPVEQDPPVALGDR